jgi:hypothetical protein
MPSPQAVSRVDLLSMYDTGPGGYYKALGSLYLATAPDTNDPDIDPDMPSGAGGGSDSAAIPDEKPPRTPGEEEEEEEEEVVVTPWRDRHGHVITIPRSLLPPARASASGEVTMMMGHTHTPLPRRERRGREQRAGLPPAPPSPPPPAPSLEGGLGGEGGVRAGDDKPPSEGRGVQWVFLYGKDMALARSALPPHSYRVAYSCPGGCG